MQDATSDHDTPPAYESVESLAPATASTPTKATDGPKESGRPSVQQGLSNTFDRYGKFDQGWGILQLRMVPNPGARDYRKAPWLAILNVKSEDVPRLMRDGFFWSAENVLPEEGSMSRVTSPEWAVGSSLHKRTWILADKFNQKTP